MAKAIHRVHRWDLAWKDDQDVLTLRNGVQVKMLHEDPEEGITDMLVKFPAGYTEPRHVHDGSHSVCILEGLMLAEGEPMKPGDYVYGGSHQEHGPFGYPEGCVVFSSFRGGTNHRYHGSPAGEIETPAVKARRPPS